ncbi:dihydroorotate dehydrogenase electron transfer subunit [Candidatus Micrarchaeota archaeon]|nr:dihydroorotate dehydrogenase electron transfer subunit [Candidatus Micrarchaeota archaeon]
MKIDLHPDSFALDGRASFVPVPILRIRDENPHTRTFFFKHRLPAKPGQFVMLWQPGFDEKPMSVAFAYPEKEEFGLTVAKVGPSTEHLFSLKKGDRLGVRGPYGTHYRLPGASDAGIKAKHKRIIMVGGGFGSAPLRFLTEQAVASGFHVDFIQGARSQDRLILQKDIQELGAHLHVATNDGSQGHKGLVTEVLETLLATNKGRYDAVYTCGPELMMQAVGKLSEAHGVPCQVSVERYMKCGFGVCGQCDCGGMLTCVEGPVVSYDSIKKNPEFGVFHRDGAGLKHYFK